MKVVRFLATVFAFFAYSANSQVVINEFMASNTSVFSDMVDFDDYSDWIELYNTGNSSVNIGGYYLTDNLEMPNKWRIPNNTSIAAHSHLLIFADGNDASPGSGKNFYHAAFKLSADGEQLGLFDAGLNVLDTFSFGHQFADVSYGRITSGAQSWGYFGEPTPNESNSALSQPSVVFAGEPQFSVESGIYHGVLLIAITAPQGSEIRYTTDGSRPVSTSTVYTAPISISQTMVLRARLFETGKIPGTIVTKTYLMNENTNGLPVISFTTFPENLWDPLKGIYSNEIKDREIPISFEYFKSNGKLALSANAGARLSGDYSHIFPNKPFTIYARSKYGDDYLDYPFFSDRKMHLFKSIYLRNSGYPDNQYTMFRDGAAHSFALKSVEIDCQAYQPSIMFINGQYWGIYNIREKLNGDYFEQHYQINEDFIDYLKYEWNTEPTVLNGDSADYHQFLSIMNNNMADPEKYQRAVGLIDLEEYVDYHITEIYFNNTNWVDYNYRFWKKRQHGAKWRWVMTDVDYGLGYSGGPNNDLFGGVMSSGETAAWVLQKFMQNPGFKNYFIQRFASLLNTGYSSEKFVQHIDSLKGNIAQEMYRHIQKWGNEYKKDFPAREGTFSERFLKVQNLFDEHILNGMTLNNIDMDGSDSKSIQTYAQWESNVEVMRNFALEREDYQRNHIANHFGLSGSVNLQIAVSSPKAGKVFAENVFITDNMAVGQYFSNIPLTLKAVPAAGFQFAGWSGISGETNPEISITLLNNASITANFVPAPVSFIPDTVDSDLVLTIENSPYTCSGDVVVRRGVCLQVNRGVEICMPQNASMYVYGSLKVNGTIDFPVIFRPYYETGASQWGALCFENASESSVLTFLHLKEATKGKDFIRHFANISAYSSDLNIQGLDISTNLIQPFYSEFGTIVIQDSRFKSNIAGDLINLKYSDSASVKNCTFIGSDAIDADAVDYDQIEKGQIIGNKIYGFFGFNSDGIDLGEEDKNIVIEGNYIYNIFDKGISIGQASTAIIRNNVFVNCGEGIGIKDDGSFVLVDRNTFYGNKVAVASFEKNYGDGGGNVEMLNCIVANSLDSPVFVDHLSVLNVRYSISDTDELAGENNLMGSPLFVNPLVNDFRLQENSPCINSGDPASALDPDGSRADIGAVFQWSPAPESPILITEICYNPSPDANSGDWIEIYNNSDEPVDLSGWAFFDSDNSHVFNIQEGLHIQPYQYYVIAETKLKFEAIYPNLSAFVYGFGFGLSNTGEALRLFDKEMNLIDIVEYSNAAPWPVLSDYFTIELIDNVLDNNVGRHWSASFTSDGTPGRKNITGPMADFNAVQLDGEVRKIRFKNNSINATDAVWDFGDGTGSAALNPTHVYDSAGEYMVRLTVHNSFGTSTFSKNITVVNWNSVVSEENAEVQCYPNPVQNNLTIKLGKACSGICQINILDALGRIVWKYGEAIPDGGTIDCNTSQWEQGVYYFMLQNGDKVQLEKIIKLE